MKPIWLAIFGMALLAGCSDDHQDMRAWMEEQAKGMHTTLPPLPKLAQFTVVDYTVADQLDPFLTARLTPKGSGGPKPKEHPPEPLEAFPLETLRMVGMMIKNNKPVALVQADKTIYPVNVGNYIGQNFGVITKITENDLTLKELVEDANGDWVERFSTMQLQEQETKK